MKDFGDRSRRWGLLLLLACLPLLGRAAGDGGPYRELAVVVLESPQLSDSVSTAPPHISRGLAAGLAVLLGPLGAHRIYLGTSPQVPVFYTITFGGFGVLALIDLGHILFTHDLDAYRDSRRMLMWAPPRDALAATRP